MVGVLFQPLNIYLLGLGGGFLIPLLYRIAKPLSGFAFLSAIIGITAISGACLWSIYEGSPPIEIFTAGSLPPFSINLRFGPWEGAIAFSVNIAALLGVWSLWDRLRDNYAAQLLYLILTMGINGMVMTRDLFNLFVFLEIVSIATYGLLGLERTPAALAETFKYIMATVLASSFLLLGAALLYHVTGTLNIDDLIEKQSLAAGPIGVVALVLILCAMIVELKPFPANGWGLDVYETAPGGLAAMVSVGVSAGVFFSLFKLLPLFSSFYIVIAIAGGISFFFSNLAGLQQTRAQRLLGYSSIAQMGLLIFALALLNDMGAQASMPLVIGGLFLNHLFAKAGLFWLAGAVRRADTDQWSAIGGQRVPLVILALLLVAIAGLPPFPGFLAKWEFVMQLAAGRKYFWIAAVLAGSLLEAAYMFRWFKQATTGTKDADTQKIELLQLAPPAICIILLAAIGLAIAPMAGLTSIWPFVPLCAGILLFAADNSTSRTKCALMLITVLPAGLWMAHDLQGLRQLFAALLLAGGLIVASASFYRIDIRPGYYPLIAVLLLSIMALLRAETSLEFLYSWELITLSSYFIVALRREARPYALSFLLFSLLSAFLLLAGFAIANAASGTNLLTALLASDREAGVIFALLAAGFLIKAASIGVHVWLPDIYFEADDDFSAMLSAVISKVAIFGLFATTYLSIRSGPAMEMAHIMGWIGALTTLFGAMMAVQQDEMKRMLAYSSMSQIGYIITAIALMSHLGWVTAFYLVANHLMTKGILFLAVAGIILRTGGKRFDELGGLKANMPFTFLAVVVALISTSGLPPLAGFGGKWLLLSAMIDKGWLWLAALTVLSTFFGFLYLFRFGYSVFLGERKAEHIDLPEAPMSLRLPQYILVAGIILLSFFPKLVMEPISSAIDPYFASSLIWNGMTLEEIYNYWNPIPVMVSTSVAAAALLLIFWLVYRIGRDRMVSLGQKQFFAFYKAAFAPLEAFGPAVFWNRLSALIIDAGGIVRRVYTGDGQTYALYVLLYLVAIYLAGTAAMSH